MTTGRKTAVTAPAAGAICGAPIAGANGWVSSRNGAKRLPPSDNFLMHHNSYNFHAFPFQPPLRPLTFVTLFLLLNPPRMVVEFTSVFHFNTGLCATLGVDADSTCSMLDFLNNMAVAIATQRVDFCKNSFGGCSTMLRYFCPRVLHCGSNYFFLFLHFFL